MGPSETVAKYDHKSRGCGDPNSIYKIAKKKLNELDKM